MLATQVGKSLYPPTVAVLASSVSTTEGSPVTLPGSTLADPDVGLPAAGAAVEPLRCCVRGRASAATARLPRREGGVGGSRQGSGLELGDRFGLGLVHLLFFYSTSIHLVIQLVTKSS